MVLNAAVQMLREADELKQKITKFKSGTSMLQERGLWVTQQQLQKVYQKVLVLDLDYALDKKVEQDLWNIGFKQQIEALQAISKDRKNPLRSEGQAMLSWVLQAAAGFYLCLLHQICTTFKLDLPFRRRASLLGCVEGWGAGGVAARSLPAPAAARYICQHCLVHLGDLARYRQQLRIAHTFYRHALVVSAHSGQPYNQLALVAWRRGRRLAALYWHVRSLMVRTPFPPAPANLARTLAAAAAAATGRETKELPVLPGVTPPPTNTVHVTPTAPLARLDAHTYVTELIRVLHMIHTLEELDTASTLVNTLNSSLTALVATDSFEAMTLVKMSCVLIWIVHSTTEDMSVDSSALSEAEARGAKLGATLAAGAALALLLPAYTAARPPARALPALKVWLSWMVREGRTAGGAWAARPQLWPALAHSLALLARDVRGFDHTLYTTVPLPEDEELHGFVPLEHEFTSLRFAEHAAWDTYGGRLPDMPRTDGQPEDEDSVPSSTEVSSPQLDTEPELEHRVRAHRILQLGKKLAQMRPEHLTYTEEEGNLTFTAHASCGEQLSAALAELSMVRGAPAPAVELDAEDDESEDERPPPPPPIVISEADFREKVREKRIGILKPQGSLERAREERALANTQEDQDGEGSTKGEDKKERKQRVNIAMAAIMRKQEETNKQVKFVTPPLTSDSTTDTGEVCISKEQEKPKIIQPKAIKSLNNLPLGRKTGGILSLKDKSAGYPHLVNTEPEPKKPEKEEKKEPKAQASSQNSQQSFQQKRQDHPPSPNWNANMQQNITLADTPRINFQKNYGIQSAGISYSPNCQPSSNQGIRLPVVNPKEIDVRTAALQKQSSRQELFQDGGKFGNHNNHMSGDKKNFLNDLPPRFANQYRYWQNVTENQFNENKFRDDNIINNNNSQQNPYFGSPQLGPKWTTPQINTENLHVQQQIGQWWKSGDNMPKFNSTIPPPTTNLRTNYYAPHAADHTNSYQIIPSFNMPNQNIGLNKTDSNMLTSNYMQSNLNQPQFQTLQNLVTSPNFNSSLNSFGSFAPAVGYDSSMYPQFGNNKLSYQPPQMKIPDKPQMGYEGNKDLMDMSGLNFGTHLLDTRQSNLGINFNDSLQNKGYKNMDQLGTSETNASGSEIPSNTYSLFSGAAEGAWRSGPRPPPSLWSGPGPSPLERLLDQQKHMKQPPTQ